MARYATLPYTVGGVPPSCLSASQGKAIYVKPYSGAAGNSGKTPQSAAKTLSGAHTLATADQNDIVYLLAESNTAASTTDYQSTTLTWSKDLVHLIGQGAPSKFGLRSRVAWLSTASSASDIPLVTWSADACLCENIQFFSGINDANLSFNVSVTGSRNVFRNCAFQGIGHATNDATDAYSLKVSGSENLFENCVIGLDTIVRAGSNVELWITGGRNYFKDCFIVAYSETAGRCLVKVDNTAGDIRYQFFENCKFCNYTVNLATGPTNVFDMPASGSTAYVWLDSNCNAFGGGAAGIGSAWADTDTSIFVAAPIPNTAGGKALAAT